MHDCACHVTTVNGQNTASNILCDCSWSDNLSRSTSFLMIKRRFLMAQSIQYFRTNKCLVYIVTKTVLNPYSDTIIIYFFTHLQLCLATAIHNCKWPKIIHKILMFSHIFYFQEQWFGRIIVVISRLRGCQRVLRHGECERFCKLWPFCLLYILTFLSFRLLISYPKGWQKNMMSYIALSSGSHKIPIRITDPIWQVTVNCGVISTEIISQQIKWHCTNIVGH